MDKGTQGRAAHFQLGISRFSLDLCRNVMAVSTEAGLGRVGGAGEGCWQCHRGSVARAHASRVPAGPALFALAPLSPNRGCSAQLRRFPGEIAVARTPLPCLCLHTDPPMGKQEMRL